MAKQSQLFQLLLIGKMFQALMITAILQSYDKPYNFHITQRKSASFASLLEFNIKLEAHQI